MSWVSPAMRHIVTAAELTGAPTEAGQGGRRRAWGVRAADLDPRPGPPDTHWAHGPTPLVRSSVLSAWGQ